MPNDHDPTLSDCLDDCAPCGLHEPRRNAYYDGKMLTARDLKDEQTYLNGMRHLGNMLLEGEGTVCGLKLEEHPNDGCRSTHIVLRKGMALSCCGQEIIVPEDTTIPFAELIADNPDLQEPGQDIVVKLCRDDQAAEMAPVLIADCCADGAGMQASRIAERFGITLEAVAPGTLAVEREVIEPDLKWLHSINTEDERPLAVTMDEGAGLVYVASRFDSDIGVDEVVSPSAHVRAYNMANHAHELTLSGMEDVHDLVAPASSKWLFVAGTKNDKSVVALYDRTPAHGSAPFFQFEVGAGKATQVQLAVSPKTGTLVVFSLQSDGTPALQTWTETTLNAKKEAADASLTGATLPDVLLPMSAGCRVLSISPNGETLALVLAGAARSQVHLVRMSKLTGGDFTKIGDLAKTVARDTGGDVTTKLGKLSSVQFSYDSSVLHVMGRASNTQVYWRLAAGDDGSLTQIGRGAKILLGAGDKSLPNLNVAPDERWLYVTSALPEGATPGDGAVAVFATQDAKAPGTQPAEVDAIAVVSLFARLKAGAMAVLGDRIYVPGHEDDDGVTRGRVMLIDVAEADIAGMFETAIDGCHSCGEGCCCVTLGHISGYDGSGEMPVRDADQAGEGDASIDNLSHRPMVPSNTRLMEAILEIAARGTVTGPPGARGEDGRPGEAGPGISDVIIEDDRTDPDIREESDGSLTLLLPPGEQGPRGPAGPEITVARYPTQTEINNGIVLPHVQPIGDGSGNLELIIERPAEGGGVEAPKLDDYFYVKTQSIKTGTVLTSDQLGTVASVSFTLTDQVTNPEVLLVDNPDGSASYLSGALEVRVHTWGWPEGDDLAPPDNEVGLRSIMPKLQHLIRQHSFQFSPLFESMSMLTNDQITFNIDLEELWVALQGKTRFDVHRARVEIVLHGTHLENDRGAPFDGRYTPDEGRVQPAETGGVWRMWFDIFEKG